MNEADNKIVSSCVCVIIPNLTRNVRPYAFIENVVTLKDYRGRGYATECLNYAKEIAKMENCYKMMLLTGSKEESILKFYRSAGYNSSDKTAFIQWLEIGQFPFIKNSIWRLCWCERVHRYNEHRIRGTAVQSRSPHPEKYGIHCSCIF